MNEFICTNTECGNEWEDAELTSICPVCGAEGSIKPPAPPGGIKIRP
jgi:rubrerythrin